MNMWVRVGTTRVPTPVRIHTSPGKICGSGKNGQHAAELPFYVLSGAYTAQGCEGVTGAREIPAWIEYTEGKTLQDDTIVSLGK